MLAFDQQTVAPWYADVVAVFPHTAAYNQFDRDGIDLAALHEEGTFQPMTTALLDWPESSLAPASFMSADMEDDDDLDDDEFDDDDFDDDLDDDDEFDDDDFDDDLDEDDDEFDDEDAEDDDADDE